MRAGIRDQRRRRPDSCPRGGRLDLRLAVHRRLLRAVPRLIFDALPKVYDDPGDLGARTDMANAATLAGQAFSNAFVGTNHALAHAVGARFGIAHGRANGLFLPHVLRYNAALPSKFMQAPGYSAYIAPDEYAQRSASFSRDNPRCHTPSPACTS